MPVDVESGMQVTELVANRLYEIQKKSEVTKTFLKRFKLHLTVIDFKRIYCLKCYCLENSD